MDYLENTRKCRAELEESRILERGCQRVFLCLCFWFFFFLINFFLRWVFLAACGHSLVWCAGFSLVWLLLLLSPVSRHVDLSSCGSRALGHGLSSCGLWAQLLRGMRNLPGPAIEPASPALAGRFLLTVQLGKSLQASFLKHALSIMACHRVGTYILNK